jgi:hypothetical protein
MLSFIMPSVIMLSVAAPLTHFSNKGANIQTSN